jgi:non-ribosomal peptide synthetase component F
MFMSGYRLLKPNSLPSLRYSLFCGEALSAKLAAEWQAAASHSIVENLYGPTETTIAICHYRWDDKESPQQCINGIVPIGYPFKGQQACVVKEIRQSGNQKEVILASVGEAASLLERQPSTSVIE